MRNDQLRYIALFLLLATLPSCLRPDTTAPQPDPATQLQAIPPANPEKYRDLKEMKGWQNPTLIVREDGIGLLDLANHEIHILKPEDVPAALADLPPSAWPYGRVVAVQLNGAVSGTEAGKVRMRENRALLVGTLESLKVTVSEIPSA